MWPSPNDRTPGVSTIQPLPMRSDTVDEEVCRPRPVTSFTRPIARIASGTRAFTSVDLPTPEWPTATVVWPCSADVSASTGTASARLSNVVRPSPAKLARNGAGFSMSVFVMHSSGVMPASNAATRYRSTRRVRGSGLAAATTMSIWSALATMIRSTASVSSALRRSKVDRSCTRTIRERLPSSPVVSPTSSTQSPVTTEYLPSSRALVATSSCSSGVFSATHTPYRPRSTLNTLPSTVSPCSGRTFVRGLLPLGFGRTFADDSS